MVVRHCHPCVTAVPLKLPFLLPLRRPLSADGHNHGQNLQPTPAYGGLLDHTTVSHSRCSGLLQPI